MDNQEDQDSRLLDSLYSAAGDPEAWNQFLGHVAQRLDAPWTGFISMDQTSHERCLNFQFGIPPEATRLYEHYYGSVDPWFLGYKQKNLQGWVGIGSALCGPAEFERTEFYNDFFRHFDVSHECGMIVDRGDG